MYRNLFSVATLTLLSRATGFLRDVMLGAVLGAGLLADAFYVAFRLPNHFRAIFAEGAFNAAFVPTYSRVLEAQGGDEARTFSGQVLTLLALSQIVVLALALAFTPELVRLLAPGFEDDPTKFALAVSLTRITFPYLLFVTLVTLHTGALNAHRRFAAGAFAPVLLNLAMIVVLPLAYLFPDAAYASAVAVTLSGAAQLVFIVIAAKRARAFGGLTRPRWTRDTRQFFAALAPAVIGSAGFQIALFADTIIASLLPTGAVSSIYYADRIYQLPIGVIGIAAGSVLLPEMSRRFAAGDDGAAFHAQNRTMALTIALGAPFFVAFLTIPLDIMRGVFLRGRFTEAAAESSAAVLAAYGVGLMAIVLIASARASFQSKGDTRTPMLVSLAAVALNVALKVALYKPFGAPGLAMATAVGAWINVVVLVALALRRKLMRPDPTLWRVCAAVAIACVALAFVALAGRAPAMAAADAIGVLRAEVGLVLLGAAGAIVYAAALAVALRALGVRLARPRRA